MTIQPQRLHVISKLRNIVFRGQRLNEINTVAQMPTLQELLHSQTDEEKLCEDSHTINCWTQLHGPNRETIKENKNKICRRSPRLLLKGGGPYKTPEQKAQQQRYPGETLMERISRKPVKKLTIKTRTTPLDAEFACAALQALGIQGEEVSHKLSQVIQATEDRLKTIEKQQPPIAVRQLSHAPNE
jgi:hypothetical protein